MVPALRLSIQRESCFWKVPLSSKVEFCFSKGPQADIPFFVQSRSRAPITAAIVQNVKAGKVLKIPTSPSSHFPDREAQARETTHPKPCNKLGPNQVETHTCCFQLIHFSSPSPEMLSVSAGPSPAPKQPLSSTAIIQRCCRETCFSRGGRWLFTKSDDNLLGAVLHSLQNTFMSFISPSINVYLSTPYTFYTCQSLSTQCSPMERQFSVVVRAWPLEPNFRGLQPGVKLCGLQRIV